MKQITQGPNYWLCTHFIVLDLLHVDNPSSWDLNLETREFSLAFTLIVQELSLHSRSDEATTCLINL